MGLCGGISSMLFKLLPCGPSSQARSISMDSLSEPRRAPSTLLPGPSDTREHELDELEWQIKDLDNLALDLSTRRHAIARTINDRHGHDILTWYLPIELISDIFMLITSESNDLRRYMKDEKLAWNPALQLGAVCRRWRDITLSTPQLWTHLVVVPKKHIASPDIAEKWISRSLNLPLTLKVFSEGGDYEESFQPSTPLPHQNIVQLLRSHANRWQDLTLEGPMELYHLLLNGLEERLSVNLLHITLSSSASCAFKPITMEYPFSPQSLYIEYLPLQRLPIQWDRLTKLVATTISLDAFLHILFHARNLQSCFADWIQSDTGHYPMDISPVTNTSIKVFNTMCKGLEPRFPIYVLERLSFPYLAEFDWAVEDDGDRSDPSEDIEMLNNFFGRHPPLQKFLFSYFDCFHCRSTEWYLSLPSITSLDLRVREWKNNGQRIHSYLEGLGSHVQPMALPRLRELEIRTGEWNTRCWNALAAIFPDDEHGEDVAPVVHPRPLKIVKISIDVCFEFDEDMRPEKIIPKVAYARLCAIQKTGVDLQVFDGNEIAIFGPRE